MWAQPGCTEGEAAQPEPIKMTLIMTVIYMKIQIHCKAPPRRK